MQLKLAIITVIGCFILAAAGCQKCYDCTKKCGTCALTGQTTKAACQGDTVLQGYSVEAWKAYYETLGYTCTYNNAVQSVCGEDNKEELSGKYYECISN